MKYKKQAIIAAAVVIAVAAAAAGMCGYNYYTNQKAGNQEEILPEEEVEEQAPAALPPQESVQKKEETVYVQADAKGTPQEIIVSDILRNGTQEDEISDRSDLKDIKNVKGRESFKKDESGALVWQAEGKDIYYQGTSDKMLPVELKITYYMEGVETEPEEMAGKAGNVKIRFDYVNHEVQTVMVNGEERTIYTPFVALTGVILDEDKFVNVEMENGKVISDGSRIMAGGMVLPGLSESIALSEIEDLDDLDIPEYLEVSAYTTCFELPMTMTAVTSDFSEELDLDDLDSYEDLKDDMQELKDASEEIIDGTHELVDGVVELKDGSDELYDGAVELDDGAKKIEDGAKELDNGAYDLRDGALELKDALKAYNEALAQVLTAVQAVMPNLGLPPEEQVNAGLASFCQKYNVSDPTKLLTHPDLEDSDKQQIQPLLVAKALYSAPQLQDASGQILDGARELYDGTKELKDGTEELLDGANELKDGTVELLDGTVELKDGVQELYDGSIELRDGVEEFDEDGIQKLYDMVCKDLQNVIDRARAAADAGKAYKAYTQIAPGMEGKVKFLIETEAVE